MFGRKTKKPRTAVIHTAECTAIHEALLMSLYLGYGAPSAPLFIPTGSLMCRCDNPTVSSAGNEPVNERVATETRTLVDA